ncbi:Exoribonuclease 2, partial [Haemophilus influenzae]
MCIRDRY